MALLVSHSASLVLKVQDLHSLLVLQELGKRSGLVISTGGGCGTRPEHYDLLHQNGTLFCIHRDLSVLSTDGRPLSKSAKLSEMYQIRKPLYEKFADYHVDNNASAEAAAVQILKIWEEPK